MKKMAKNLIVILQIGNEVESGCACEVVTDLSMIGQRMQGYWQLTRQQVTL